MPLSTKSNIIVSYQSNNKTNRLLSLKIMGPCSSVIIVQNEKNENCWEAQVVPSHGSMPEMICTKLSAALNHLTKQYQNGNIGLSCAGCDDILCQSRGAPASTGTWHGHIWTGTTICMHSARRGGRNVQSPSSVNPGLSCPAVFSTTAFSVSEAKEDLGALAEWSQELLNSLLCTHILGQKAVVLKQEATPDSWSAMERFHPGAIVTWGVLSLALITSLAGNE